MDRNNTAESQKQNARGTTKTRLHPIPPYLQCFFGTLLSVVFLGSLGRPKLAKKKKAVVFIFFRIFLYFFIFSFFLYFFVFCIFLYFFVFFGVFLILIRIKLFFRDAPPALFPPLVLGGVQ